MDNKYGGVIWTNHALARLRERNVKQGDAWATWNRPQSSQFDATKGVWVYKKVWGDTEIEIVAKQNDKKEWLILSVWSKSVYLKLQQKNTSFLSLFFNNLFKSKI